MKVDAAVHPADLKPKMEKLWDVSAHKLASLHKSISSDRISPVYTVEGKYTSRGWTEWTRGFVYGSLLFQFEATGDEHFLRAAKEDIARTMSLHLSHTGVHDHGFQNVSTYGNLLRLMEVGKIARNEAERRIYVQALKLSGAVQASRWTKLPDCLGYVYSFNGPHSLFADTIRSMRILALSHMLGHVLMAEQDQEVNLLERMLQHMETTARYAVYFGADRDLYDIRGRVAHESIFNVINGSYRCPGTQQGYSPFSTWTRGLAWILLGYAEELEFLQFLPDEALEGLDAGGIKGREMFIRRFLEAALVTADFYIANTPTDGVPYWDTGAPGLAKMGDVLSRPSDPFNDSEPVDSSAAAIAAQGLIRLGHFLIGIGEIENGEHMIQAGWTTAKTLLEEPYASFDTSHQGLILHSVYHRPNGWDHIPDGRKIPCGESSMWGDYHMRELMVVMQRLIDDEPYHTYFNGIAQE